MYKLGPHQISGRYVLAPMAGITDLPFRELALGFGASAVTSEMLTSDTSLWGSVKSASRLKGLVHDSKLSLADKVSENTSGVSLFNENSLALIDGFPCDTKAAVQSFADRLVAKQLIEKPLKIVQIAGGDVETLSTAARFSQDLGVDVIDVNMGCPAKKVCKKAAGSALLKDQVLVEKLLRGVRDSVQIPVTLKTRTGWSIEQKNGADVAKLAAQIGINAIAIHGRTRECRFKGEAEYHEIRRIKSEVSIPVIANGDITSTAKASKVASQTACDALMIGRGALGRPWLFSELNHADAAKAENKVATKVARQQQLAFKLAIATIHTDAIHRFYGEIKGPRIARKHFGWYVDALIDDHFSMPVAHSDLGDASDNLYCDNQSQKPATNTNNACQTDKFCNTKFTSQGFDTYKNNLTCDKANPSQRNERPAQAIASKATSVEKDNEQNVASANDSAKHASSKQETRLNELGSDSVGSRYTITLSAKTNEFAIHQLRKTKRLFNSTDSGKAQLDLIRECFYQLQFLSSKEEIAA